MIGQGSPKTSRLRDYYATGRRYHRSTWGVWLLAIALSLACLDARAGEFRLRISWGGQEARRWEGAVWLSEGLLGEPRSLGIEADEPGSMWLQDGHLIIRGHSVRSYDGVDLSIQASRDAKLNVQLTADGDHPVCKGSTGRGRRHYVRQHDRGLRGP